MRRNRPIHRFYSTFGIGRWDSELKAHHVSVSGLSPQAWFASAAIFRPSDSDIRIHTRNPQKAEFEVTCPEPATYFFRRDVFPGNEHWWVSDPKQHACDEVKALGVGANCDRVAIRTGTQKKTLEASAGAAEVAGVRICGGERPPTGEESDQVGDTEHEGQQTKERCGKGDPRCHGVTRPRTPRSSCGHRSRSCLRGVW